MHTATYAVRGSDMCEVLQKYLDSNLKFSQYMYFEFLNFKSWKKYLLMCINYEEQEECTIPKGVTIVHVKLGVIQIY